MRHDDGDAQLRPEDVPAPDADFGAINEFGHTFDGYEYAESRWPERDGFDTCCELGERVRAALTAGGDGPSEFSIDELRAALFWEMRAARWTTQGVDFPDDETLAYYHRLIECIRERVTEAATAILDVEVDPI